MTNSRQEDVLRNVINTLGKGRFAVYFEIEIGLAQCAVCSKLNCSYANMLIYSTNNFFALKFYLYIIEMLFPQSIRPPKLWSVNLYGNIEVLFSLA